MKKTQHAADEKDGMQVRHATADDRDVLFDVWLKSVRATQTFVSEADIQSFIPLVRDYLGSSATEFWVLCAAEGAVRQNSIDRVVGVASSSMLARKGANSPWP